MMRNTGSAARRLGLHPSSAPHCAGSVRSCLHLSFVCCAPGIWGFPHRIRGWDELAWGCADKDHAPAGSAAAGAAAMIPAGIKELDSISVICPLLESLWLGALAFSSSLRRYVFCVTTEVPHLDSLLCGIKRRGCSLDSGVAAVRHVWCLSALCPPGNPTQSFPYFFTEPVFINIELLTW